MSFIFEVLFRNKLVQFILKLNNNQYIRLTILITYIE
jgi:hypothetical protein